ncbi:protein FAF-like, chloroplastic isoform X2 [Hibiscus syriacus]|uniref:protein FAF-like, chloroplastic isoform X2 n=1 Tax=Hibiscus syriacus TaxID=106335 RepID=UPI001923DBB6|nr:protein FAF-like, chloroplastic isoform X2 [Hibiscus syriacus]
MSGPLCKNLGLSSALNIIEEAINVTEKQGIVSILGSDADQRPTVTGSSLRRTLSADMSSKKWLTLNEFSPLKRIASSEDFPVPIADSSSEQDCEDKKDLDKPCQFDIWSSIVSKKADDESLKSLPPPYVHPLVERSGSCLNEKSLEICTESLGSETGSDGFSSYPPSETGDVEEDRKEEDQHGVLQQQKTACFDDEDDQLRYVKCNYDVVGKKSPQYGSFPPPIPSLSRKDGASVRMETHRDNGRLVLEAVSVPSKNNFLAQRQDGRLVLTFSNTINESEEKGKEEEDMCRGMEQGPKLESGAMNVHRLAAMMNKPIWLANRNPTWPKTFDEIVKLGEEKVEPTTLPPPSLQSLPPGPRVVRLIPSPPPPPSTIAAASFNAYEYYWSSPDQGMSSKAAILTPLAQQSPPSLLVDNGYKHLLLPKNQTANDQQHLLVLRGNNGDYFVPLLRGCKESRKSLVFSGPYCIATS